jgi:hypothetical protein
MLMVLSFEALLPQSLVAAIPIGAIGSGFENSPDGGLHDG